MSSDARYSRRHFVAGALGVAGAVMCLESHAGASRRLHEEPAVLLFDPARSDARDRAAGMGAGWVARPIVGDRVRFAREMLGNDGAATAKLAGLTSYGDFILLSGCAAEAGYRLTSESLYRAPGGLEHGALVHWVVERARRPTRG